MTGDGSTGPGPDLPEAAVRRDHPREFRALVRSGTGPWERVRLTATSYDDARAQIADRFGPEVEADVWDEWAASRPC